MNRNKISIVKYTDIKSYISPVKIPSNKMMFLPCAIKEVAESEGWHLAITITKRLFLFSLSASSVIVTSWQSLPC